ncbi:hypothetical protein MAR_030397 [Mya arenaria]|uniref:Uncharacterized protein n=1 Tax=Mya arenaria TaxID=6604 RepID=A0ABY7F522_MYAAR|nr:hypothetical protein MAR_030397 [Mya arenaria]
MLQNKRSVIQIKNNDELCCARAIITAIAQIENHPQWNSIRLGRAIQGQLAETLHQKAGVPLQRCGIEEVKKFQAVLPNYQIHVLSKEHFNGIIYDGVEGGEPIYLYYHDQHFDVITKMTGFLNRSYFCESCKKGYSNKEKHYCNNPCVYCHQLHSEEEDKWTFCSKCNRNFKSDVCFKMHLKTSDAGKSTCNTYFKCENCDQTINMDRHKKAHVCHEVYCKTCKDFVTEDHMCYMQPVIENTSSCERNKIKKDKVASYIFFDFECTQDERLQCEQGYTKGQNGKCGNCNKSWCGSFEHRPNFCVAQKVCGKCLQNPVSPQSTCHACACNLVFRTNFLAHESIAIIPPHGYRPEEKQSVKNIHFVNNESVKLEWVYNDDFVEPSARTNVIIAAYTTSQARLKLYNTDSLVFTTRPGEWEPPLGDYLGDLPDEVPRNTITAFVTGGPKNYAYSLRHPTKNGHTSICKVRGITLNFKNSLDINFQTVKDMVTGKGNVCVTVIDENKIARNPSTGHIITKRENKDYKIVFDKRVIGKEYLTHPYGY